MGATPEWWNTREPLTRSLDYTEEGLAMDATRAPRRPNKRIEAKATHEITYENAHTLVLNAKGRAAQYECVTCAAPAREWAYDWTDTDPRYDVRTGHAFSLDPDRYNPMCVSCHRSMDINRPVAQRWKHPRHPVRRMPQDAPDEIAARAALRTAEMADRFGLTA